MGYTFYIEVGVPGENPMSLVSFALNKYRTQKCVIGKCNVSTCVHTSPVSLTFNYFRFQLNGV